MLLRENFSCRMSEIGFAETGSEATLAKAEKLVREAAAKELDIVIPVSFFERTGNVAFNSVVIIDADGCLPVLL